LARLNALLQEEHRSSSLIDDLPSLIVWRGAQRHVYLSTSPQQSARRREEATQQTLVAGDTIVA